MDVEAIVQGWPVNGQKGMVTRDELRAAIQTP
jgi:hypothetical protein